MPAAAGLQRPACIAKLPEAPQSQHVLAQVLLLEQLAHALRHQLLCDCHEQAPIASTLRSLAHLEPPRTRQHQLPNLTTPNIPLSIDRSSRPRPCGCLFTSTAQKNPMKTYCQPLQCVLTFSGASNEISSRMRSSTVCSRRAPMLSTELLTSSATRATWCAHAHTSVFGKPQAAATL